jgi:hypothetical protein
MPYPVFRHALIPAATALRRSRAVLSYCLPNVTPDASCPVFALKAPVSVDTAVFSASPTAATETPAADSTVGSTAIGGTTISGQASAPIVTTNRLVR